MLLLEYFIAMIGGSIQYHPEFLFWLVVRTAFCALAVGFLFKWLLGSSKKKKGAEEVL